ncbi:MAG: type II toxin-antitoxin system RelE/ParE family toxin [Lentisphaeraceae bacterium]|nr:type II toxin-antitoxin system RelE/ParE family toxin [Lentisphaeraceae bacterium]
MQQYFLTKAAKADLIEIVDYTFETWGGRQLLNYQRELEERLQTLLVFPEMGRKHESLPANIRYIHEGSHYIFYKKADDGIEILRFLHEKMDIIEQLGEEL